MPLFEDLQALMIKHHFRPEKRLSQFFCINEALLLFLVNRASLKKGDVVLEIGPGTGFLTKKLLEKCASTGAKVVAIEPDDLMLEVLESEFASEIKSGLLSLQKGSALDFDYSKLGVTKIVSLPPYHISSDLLTKIGLTPKIEKCILVLDRGFVQKLTAFEGFTEYVALTVLLNLNARVEVLEDIIEQQSFFPQPNCLSSVVELDFNTKNNSEEFFAFLKEIFRYKNKDLQRALKKSFPFLSKKLGWKQKPFDEMLAKLKLAQKKVYLLSPKEFLEVFELLNSKK
jgi:16S rRNA A1518/A1519 N6-dimethyltransferase RsmA/KsgA/DIM1 with predicted DNA glycosylase/AP lyase activity